MASRQAEIVVNSRIEDVFHFVTDWRYVSLYERSISRITLQQTLPDGDRIGRVHMRIAGIPFRWRYRYSMEHPSAYGGFQLRGLIRGAFWFRFTALDENRTHVTHAEVISSRWKWLERLAASIFRTVLPSNLDDELAQLKRAIEGPHRLPPAELHRYGWLGHRSLLQ
jgi:hypothetical protein